LRNRPPRTTAFMTVGRALADRAAMSLSNGAEQYLRALCVGNVAAGLGKRGSSNRLIEALPDGMLEGEGGRAYRLAMLLHARTQDDFFPFGRVHVGAQALASCLALAHQAKRPLMQCIAAVYEVTCLVSAAYSSEAQQRGFRPSGVFGPIGVAAGAALAIGLDVEGVATAVCLATVMTSGTNQTWLSGTDEWLLEIGAATRAGVEAAQLAARGVRASPVAFEGPAGWARALWDDEGATRLVRALEDPTTMIPAVAHKPYPVSGIAQVPSLLACRAHGILAGAVPDKVLVKLSPVEASYPGSSNRGPFAGRSDALMSVSHCVACGLADGLVRLQRLESPNQADVARIAERIEVVADPSCDESSALLTFGARGGDTVELSATGSEILHTSWIDLLQELPALADRTESTRENVHAVVEQMALNEPDFSVLAELLENSHD
jgi:2-methylcitrate dehydratase PrpD